jgi:phosphatidate cytidylyltransferase
MIYSIMYGYQHIIGFVIFSLGAYEIVRVWLGRGKSPLLLLISLVMYAAIGYLFLQFMAQQGEVELLLFVYITVLVFDGFSQVSGQLFGKTKLVPSISPAKTLEGLMGGLIMAFVTSWLMWGAGSDHLTLTFVNCAFAFAGDLLASYYKRKCGVKDYSNLIPGHGGVLDRFDSFILAGATWWIIEAQIYFSYG